MAIAFAATILVLLTGASPSVASTGSRSTGHRDEPSSIVLIVTDDQRWDMIGGLPNVARDIADHGVVFRNAFVSNPLCCPSRASILTGDYSHTTHVYRQIPPFGRWESFDDTSTLATWLHDGGYRTGLFGKYIDGYQHPALTGYVPPGWDRWAAFVHSAYYDYKLSEDGTVESYGTAPADYSTDVLARQAVSFIRSAPGPLFVYFAPPAPHAPAIPASRYAGLPAPPPGPRPPSFDEADVSDKPAYVQALPTLSPDVSANLDALRANQHRTLRSVDDAVGAIVDALRATGRLHDTLIVFTSDNGLAFGEHRWTRKEVPYEESIRVPLMVRFDPATGDRPRSDSHLVANIDLAPTAAAVAGVDHPRLDGRSVLPLLRDSSAPWRHDLLLEHMEGTNPVPSYCGVRSEHAVYVEYTDGERELYDLRADPFELVNRAGQPAYSAQQRSLEGELHRLCRPPPPVLPASTASVNDAMLGVVAMFALLVGGALVERRRDRRLDRSRGHVHEPAA